MNTKLITAALACVAALATAGQADAQTWKVNGSYVVRLNDLDLSTTAGREQLLRRAEQATARVCVAAGVRQKVEACRVDTLRAAMAQSGPTLRGALTQAMVARESVQLAKR